VEGETVLVHEPSPSSIERMDVHDQIWVDVPGDDLALQTPPVQQARQKNAWSVAASCSTASGKS
jgi:hypothetical protein